MTQETIGAFIKDHGTGGMSRSPCAPTLYAQNGHACAEGAMFGSENVHIVHSHENYEKKIGQTAKQRNK